MARVRRTARRHDSRGGFTLVEVLMATAILSFVVAVLTHSVAAGQAQTYDSLHQTRALFLAEALMDEMVRLPYADPDDGSNTLGPETGESTRADYDNIDDYHGYPRTATIESSTSINDLHGVAYPSAYTGFTRTVTCAYESQTCAELGGTLDGLSITVTVTDSKGRTWTLTRFVMDDSESSS